MKLISLPAKVILLFAIFLSSFSIVSASDIDSRASDLLNMEATGSNGINRLIAQSYNDQPYDRPEIIDNILLGLPCSRNVDFRITELVRFLFISDGDFEDEILAVVDTFDFWLNYGEDNQQYWSENHMIMWMTANWLLHERYGWEARETLRQNLVHYLNLKIDYGFYEYFSSIYYPFTITALLNLVDFVEDSEIKMLAERVVTRILKDLLLIVNNQGAYYPTAGRNDMGKYIRKNHLRDIIYLLTGIGEVPSGLGNAGMAISTSDFDFSEISNSWSPEVNTTLNYGHPLSKAKQIHAGIEFRDRVIFQWSSGAYFHPTTASDTWLLLRSLNLWGHYEFQSFAFAQILPPSLGNLFGKISASISRSSYIGKVDIDIFKDDGVVLTSSQDMWKGRKGYQIYPIAATIEDICVFPRSGPIQRWESVPSRTSNTHLPYVDQDENVALIMYRPNFDLPLFGGTDEFGVSLLWEDDNFDEVRTFDNWILGKKEDSYVAVKKHCGNNISKTIEECRTEVVRAGPVCNDSIISETEICETFPVDVQACEDSDGQTWAIVVGNVDMHGSFDDFEEVIAAAEYEERWYFDRGKFQWVYYGKINVDGKFIDYHWRGSFLNGPDDGNADNNSELNRELVSEAENIDVFPNPAINTFTLDLSQYEKDVHTVEIIDMSGRVMFKQSTSFNDPSISVRSDNWEKGTYTILFHGDNHSDIKRISIQK